MNHRVTIYLSEFHYKHIMSKSFSSLCSLSQAGAYYITKAIDEELKRQPPKTIDPSTQDQPQAPVEQPSENIEQPEAEEPSPETPEDDDTPIWG